MAKLYKLFPRGDAPPSPGELAPPEVEPLPPVKRPGLAAAVIRFVWVATVLLWPLLKWVLSILVFFQAVRMVFLWDDPAAHAGWTFLLHFAGLTALTYFVSIYRPKGL